MSEERDVKWIIIVSLVSFYVSWMFSWGYYLPSDYGVLETAVLYISRFSTIFFVATLTTITLYAADFGKKDLMFKVSMYLFIISMALFCLSILRYMFLRGY